MKNFMGEGWIRGFDAANKTIYTSTDGMFVVIPRWRMSGSVGCTWEVQHVPSGQTRPSLTLRDCRPLVAAWREELVARQEEVTS